MTEEDSKEMFVACWVIKIHDLTDHETLSYCYSFNSKLSRIYGIVRECHRSEHEVFPDNAIDWGKLGIKRITVAQGLS